MNSRWGWLWLGLGLAASMTVNAHGGESHAWENTTLKADTRKKIEEGATQYRSCLNDKSKPLLVEAGDSRQQTDRVLKECEATLMAVKQAFRLEKVPEPLSDRYLKRLRTQGARDVLQALMYAQAQRSVAAEPVGKAPVESAAKVPDAEMVAQVAGASPDSPSAEVDRLAGLIPSAVDFSRLPETLDRLHLLLGGGLFASILALMVMALLRKPASSDPLMPPVTHAATRVQEPVAPVPVLAEVTPDAAIQLLGLLQKDARFVDFIQEDMAAFGDAEIGAVARVVHEGCRKVIHQYFTLVPVMQTPEGQSVSLEKGFDAMRIHVSGRVLGEPPFRGTLVHRGWRVENADLPSLVKGHDTRLIAAAEVEL